LPQPLHRVVVTGATGFVGRALRARLAASVDTLRMGVPDWNPRLAAANLEGATVFHLAARVHAPGSDEAAFVADNVDKTRALASAAVREGARRVVFLSSIKVYGDESPGRPLTEDDPPYPADAYGQSKLAAEQALTTIAGQAKLPFTIVRSSLVFGPDARANLLDLLRLADTPWPLPFASLTRPRSFVQVDDLARLLVACAEHPAAVGRTYIAAHPVPFSTASLVAQARRALGRPARLFSLPPGLIEAVAAVAARGDLARRLTRELRADPSAAQRELGWVARVPMEQAIEEMVRDYRARQRP
jgi:UDP-glucose 4-epimerase